MLTTTQLAGFGVNGSPFLLDIIAELGLSTSLNFVLDVADLRSYNGSSQTWTDATGQGNSFFLGADGSATATDPTFNGTAGEPSEATYFSFDGGDYFTESAAHTFADNWHKNNGAFSIAGIFYTVNQAAETMYFANGANAANMDGVGIIVQGASETVQIAHSDAAATRAVETLTALTQDAWNYIGISCDEATTTFNGRINATTTSGTFTASTNADANSQPLRIGAPGDAVGPVASGTRIACLAAWSTSIGATSLEGLYTRLKSRRFRSIL
jgi:hypothetical protein